MSAIPVAGKRLAGKVAIITGGTRGIGAAATQLFLAHGARVAAWCTSKEACAEWQAQVEGAHKDQVLVQQINVTDRAAVLDGAKEVLGKWGQLDILVNNAGITRDRGFLKMTPEQWQQVLDVNLTGTFNCTQAVLPAMLEKSYGRIVNVSSCVGRYGNFGQANYAATKAGLIGYTQTLAKEFSGKGITINCVAPGFISTEMVAAMPEKVIEQIKTRTPAGRLGTPEDVAFSYLFLASDEASFVTGAVLDVNGGWQSF
jgi:3-oxoacyl-[acyl-carrier protein] reductase